MGLDARVGSGGKGAVTAPSLLEVENLSVRFGPVAAVSSITFSVTSGEVFGVVGESGAGKSATAKAIVGLLPKTARVSGSVRFEGQELVDADAGLLRATRGAGIGYVFQDALTALDPVVRIGDQLVEALRVHSDISNREASIVAENLLGEVQIKDPARTLKSYPHQLSGGMRQRVVIAAALISDPKLIIADEVTSALDVTVQRKVLELLMAVCADRGASVMMITHDLGVVAQTCDRVAVLYGGLVVEQAGVFELFDTPRHPYTKALLESMPRIGENVPFVPIPGSSIQVVGKLASCPFSARCGYATTECLTNVPGVDRVGTREFRCFHALEGST